MPVPKTDALPLGYTPYGLFVKGLVAGTDGDEGYRADAAGYREPQGCKVPGKRRSLCKVGLLITN